MQNLSVQIRNFLLDRDQINTYRLKEKIEMGTSQPDPQYPDPQHPGQPYPGHYPPQIPPKKRKIWPWVLLAVCVVLIALFGGCVALVGGAANEVGKAITSASAEADTPTAVTYRVTGTGGEAGTITYQVNGNTTQDSQVALPWAKDTEVTGYLKFASVIASLPYDGSGSITCQVLVDGKVVVENTATGPGASASCSKDVSQ